MPIGAKMYEQTASAEDSSSKTEDGEKTKKDDEPVEGEVVDDKEK
jgi:hypothetical protein